MAKMFFPLTTFLLMLMMFGMSLADEPIPTVTAVIVSLPTITTDPRLPFFGASIDGLAVNRDGRMLAASYHANTSFLAFLDTKMNETATIQVPSCPLSGKEALIAGARYVDAKRVLLSGQ